MMRALVRTFVLFTLVAWLGLEVGACLQDAAQPVEYGPRTSAPVTVLR